MSRKAQLKLYYTCPEEISAAVESRWLAELAGVDRDRLEAFTNPQDRINRLFARQLLKRLADSFNLTDFELANVNWPAGKKPGVEALHFSFSHSNGLVACAASTKVEAGLDVEYTKAPVPQPPPFMNAAQLDAIAANPTMFYKLWTRKEAICKATESGGLAGMERVRLDDSSGELDGRQWQFFEPQLATGYAACLALPPGDFACSAQHVTVASLIA